MNYVSDRLLRARDLHRPYGILPVSRSQFYSLISRGDFPRGTRLGANTVVWRESFVWEWVRERAEFFEKFSLAKVSSLRCRQQKGVSALKTDAAQRWKILADELLASGLTVRAFADERWEEGSNPITYETRSGRLRGYAAETIVRELRKELKRREKAIT